jgi:Fe-S-cluster containining protein
MLPRELSAIAKKLKLSNKQFSEKYCQLLIQLFPAPETKNSLFLPTTALPKRIQKKIQSNQNEQAFGFLALPSIALKRNKKNCIILDKKGYCLVHKQKPKQCSLFPFISLQEKPDFAKLYSFCNGLQSCNEQPKGWKKKVEAHYENFSKYFETVKQKSFKKTWLFWPKTGTILLKNKKLCSISEKEFFETLKKINC